MACFKILFSCYEECYNNRSDEEEKEPERNELPQKKEVKLELQTPNTKKKGIKKKMKTPIKKKIETIHEVDHENENTSVYTETLKCQETSHFLKEEIEIVDNRQPVTNEVGDNAVSSDILYNNNSNNITFNEIENKYDGVLITFQHQQTEINY